MHDHAPPPTAGAQHLGRLWLALALVAVLLAVELALALTTGSLALLSDAGHLATDLVGISLAIAAIRIVAATGTSEKVTYGWHRLEILAALANSLLLLGIAGYVVAEGVGRLGAPPDVPGPALVVIAVVGLAVNLLTAWLLRAGAEVSLNVEGARLEVLADAVGSVGLLIAGVAIWLTGWVVVDTLVAFGVAAWVVPRALRLGGRALRVLVQAAPSDLDVAALTTRLRTLPGVDDVHDLHVWTLTSGVEVASVHVDVAVDADPHRVLHAVEDALRDERGEVRVTVQLEPATHRRCARTPC